MRMRKQSFQRDIFWVRHARSLTDEACIPQLNPAQGYSLRVRKKVWKQQFVRMKWQAQWDSRGIPQYSASLYGKRISTAGLFGKSASGMFDGIDQLDFGLADDDGGSFFTREDKGTGFSFLKVVLIVVVLLVVFGSRSQKTRSRAAGIASKVKNRFSKS